MSTLIFQIHIKQWDKSQRSPTDVAARAAIPGRYPIMAKPEYFILNKACIIDQHGDDIATSAYSDGRLKTAVMVDGSVRLDRFVVYESDGKDILAYREENKDLIIIGCLNDGWIQSRFNWRYAVEQGGQFYWLYEEFTLNAACVKEVDADYFLALPPKQIFNAP